MILLLLVLGGIVLLVALYLYGGAIERSRHGVARSVTHGEGPGSFPERDSVMMSHRFSHSRVGLYVGYDTQNPMDFDRPPRRRHE
ncbi:MAG: hypothetical protein ACTSYX_11375 [Candidatus Thorarchaeota archaeon]